MKSFLSVVEDLAGSQPGASAFSYPGGALTYAELWGGARAMAARLHAAGVRAGDTVALELREQSAAAAMTMLYALGYLGATVLPLHPEGAPAARERLAARFRASRVVDPVAPQWQGEGGEAAPRGDAPERPFLYMFTSGTTGDARACLLSFGMLAAQRVRYASTVGTGARDCMLAPLPWPTKVGMRFALRMHAIGGTHCNAAFPESRRELAALMREFGVTQLACSPWQLRRLLTSAPAPELLAAPLRVLQVGGADVTREDIDAARRTITPNVYAVYAATEVGVLAHVRPGDAPGGQGDAGKLLPGVQAQAVDSAHRVLGPGATGNLRFRTPSMPSGYADSPQATADAFREGWFYPGDRGSVDSAGNLVLQGRAGDVINHGGVKIVPAAVEAVLAAHPDIADVAVIGVPHPLAGEQPVAFAVFRRNPDHEEVRRFCARHLDGNQIPVQILVASEIPRDAQGKVQRGRLRSVYDALRRS